MAKYTNFTKCKIKSRSKTKSTLVQQNDKFNKFSKFLNYKPNTTHKYTPHLMQNPNIPPYNYSQEPTLLHMRWYRTGHNTTHTRRRYFSDHFRATATVDYDKESHDPASDSSAFESYWDEDPLTQAPPDKFYKYHSILTNANSNSSSTSNSNSDTDPEQENQPTWSDTDQQWLQDYLNSKFHYKSKYKS